MGCTQFEERETVYSSVKQCSLLLLVSISWKFHECSSIRYYVMLPTTTDPGNRKKELCVQGVNPIIPQMFQIVSCVIANTSCKFHENPLFNFTVVLPTNTPGVPKWETVKQSRQVWNSLANYFLCQARRFIKNHDNPFNRFSIILQTNTDPGYR